MVETYNLKNKKTVLFSLSLFVILLNISMVLYISARKKQTERQCVCFIFLPVIHCLVIEIVKIVEICSFPSRLLPIYHFRAYFAFPSRFSPKAHRTHHLLPPSVLCFDRSRIRTQLLFVRRRQNEQYPYHTYVCGGKSLFNLERTRRRSEKARTLV